MTSNLWAARAVFAVYCPLLPLLPMGSAVNDPINNQRVIQRLLNRDGLIRSVDGKNPTAAVTHVDRVALESRTKSQAFSKLLALIEF